MNTHQIIIELDEDKYNMLSTYANSCGLDTDTIATEILEHAISMIMTLIIIENNKNIKQ